MMHIAFLAFWLFIALILFIGGILNNSGQSERRMERFSYKTKREIKSKIERKLS